MTAGMCGGPLVLRKMHISFAKDICHFILKMTILPRQARDKRRESAQRVMRLSQAEGFLEGVRPGFGAALLEVRETPFLKSQFKLGKSTLLNAKAQVVALFFECFPYVCSEPVLVKKIVLYINGAKQVKKTLNAIAQKHALSVLRRNCLGLPWPRVKRQES
jgi:hypothetical protein